MLETPHHFQLARQCSTVYEISSAVFRVVGHKLHGETSQQVVLLITFPVAKEGKTKLGTPHLNRPGNIFLDSHLHALNVINRTVTHIIRSRT